MKTWTFSKLSRHLWHWFYSAIPQNIESMSCPCACNPMDLNFIFKCSFFTYHNMKYISSEILPIKTSTSQLVHSLKLPDDTQKTVAKAKVVAQQEPWMYEIIWCPFDLLSIGLIVKETCPECTENADNLIGQSICIGSAIDYTIYQIFLKVNWVFSLYIYIYCVFVYVSLLEGNYQSSCLP